LGRSSSRLGPLDSLRANGPDPWIIGPHKFLFCFSVFEFALFQKEI